ncbi:MAG: LysR substrate-binding domain-containing protein [Janthinobacterium lividum]
MILNLEILRILDAIDRNGSFASAAEELHRVPSAITYAIKQMELNLGTPLFDRSNYRAQLTPIGQDLLEQGRLILDQARTLENKIKVSAGLDLQNLRLAYDGLIDFTAIKSILKNLFEFFPKTSVDVSVEILSGSQDILLSESADLVLGCGLDPQKSTLYTYETLGVIPFVFAVAPQHPIAQCQEPLTYKEITAHRIIVTPDTSRNISKIVTGYSPDHLFLKVPSIESKIQAQVAGLGIGFLPLTLAEPYLKSGLLIEKKVDRPKVAASCVLAWRKHQKCAALDFLVNLLRDNKEKIISKL